VTTGARPGPFDVLVLGSGVAGLSAAVRLAGPGGPSPSLSLGVLTKGALSQSATRWAQGGVAAVLGADEDSTDLHLADTLAAGAGLCDEEAVRVLVDEGPGRVHELIALGVEFDREATGLLALAREGGHSRPRVVHAGGAATGAEVERALVDATYSSASAVLEGWFALDLLVEDGRCTGVWALPPGAGGAAGPVEVRADHVVLATGGAGQLFSVTTNPPESTGDGVAMALRAGVPTADVEFVQFHPTALHHPAMPRPLLSEALRGHGALLRDRDGERFVDELAPRDVVSRAMAARMAEQGVDHLWLDATGLERFSARFPTIAASLSSIGLDPQRDWLPIAPAAHHLSGGVVTDLWGATALPGLWAVGEVACTGVHGANRLASNSLLEGMVFGARLAERIPSGAQSPEASGALRAVLGEEPIDGIGCTLLEKAATPRPPKSNRWPGVDVTKLRDMVQRAMTRGAGVVRSAESLADARAVVDEVTFVLADAPDSVAAEELTNLLQLADALLVSALLRTESRGAHARREFPDADPEWRRRLVHGHAPGDGEDRRG
jgi:L-aspartate oxidase